ncbi:hypothetical protein ScPMuIL_007101 [Solemya velum]
MAPNIVGSLFSVFFEYDTPRIVHIRSKKVGVINRFLQLCIIGYVIGFAIVFKKGYQDFDDVQSAVTTKVKGVALTNSSDPGLQLRIWDVSDYIVPPQENNAFFVTTNLIITENQTQGTCDEDPTIPGVNCTGRPEICNEPSPIIGHGIFTGHCIPSNYSAGTDVCEVYAWCPVENGMRKSPSPPVLEASKNFTVFVKNNIEFPKFGVKRRNILGFENDTELQNCRYNPADPQNRFCPIFILDDIIRRAHENYTDMATSGGVVQILIHWNCNLDYDVEDCVPEYQFRRLDSSQYKSAKGFNFRYAHFYMKEDKEYRTLYKAYGIKFIITVQGQAGKFSVVPLLLNIGSGLALLSVATIICDIVVLYVLKAKNIYREKKYLDVKGDDAYEVKSAISHY